MPQVDSIKTSTDQDGDMIMSDTTLLPMNPFKDKFNFDWFSFDSKIATPKSPTYSPASPDSTRKLSISTASPASYFTESPLSTEAPRNVLAQAGTSPPTVIYPPLPSKPLRWVWQCHLCHSRYPLSVTRRCLIDGHYYCSGNSQTQRNVKKRRKNQSCTSEFDYVAWKEWGQWRRKTLALRALANGKAEPMLLGCEGCSSPSQCRYDKRRPVETIKFDDFVDEEDLVMNADEVVPSDRPDSASGLTSSPNEEKSEQGKGFGKQNLKIDSNVTSSSPNQKSSKRNRFYSNLAGSLSSKELSPTSESLGSLDPALPSIAKSSTSGDNNLKAMESTLKAALAQQTQDSLQEDGAQPATRSKRRVNSKVNDPQFEITTEDIQNRLRGGSEGIGLYRTKSQQSLLTDFFRQSRSPSSGSIGDPVKRDVTRAASEADILAFLRSKPSQQVDVLNSRINRRQSAQEGGVQHFEDINLSLTKSASSLKESLVSMKIERLTGGGEQSEAVQTSTAGESGRSGTSFGFPSLIFGRK